ncbi:MAG: DEAD/DEAH box helicase [Syntrophobacterales bacterium]|nr:DEAD/DEAH box helicase [Syntrophobacterales bacterium]
MEEDYKEEQNQTANSQTMELEQPVRNGDEEHPENPLAAITLSDLSPRLQKACAMAGWTGLLPVQSQAVPYIMAGRNLMVQSQTGSGKTGAFLLPIIERINPQKKACQALVLVPTRELALQVSREAELLTEGSGLRTVVVYGGVKYEPQLEAIRAGAQLVVGTPGRILDHLLKGALKLDKLSIFVFDEADRMLSMGFYPDMKRVQQFLPKHPLNGCMFSATFSPFIIRLAEEFLGKADFLSLSRDHIHVANTAHLFYIVQGVQKERALIRIIEMENPISAIIFCNMRSTVHFVTVVLKRFGYDADELSSDLSQGDREKVMGRLRKGDLRFLVATDVAARGIDIPDLSHVFQYEPPEDPELYIHRAGRTGRVGASGTAITLAAGMEQFALKAIARSFNITDMEERKLPEENDVAEIVAQRVIAGLEADLRSRDNLERERMRRFISLGRTLSEAEEDSPLIAMLLDDYYNKTLHKAPQSPSISVAITAAVAPNGGAGKKRPRTRKPRRSSSGEGSAAAQQ